ncbi:MAG TPA: light-harvesting antenna LH1, alpha subunit [Lamprocystis sp. (in: g-proteobacteria)]|nr:light-harvesting antenna LH1, alpha subunit [Lamprocystis sp. (in: g-proteobacteria)]
MVTPLSYKPLEEDYRIWLVVNPSTWLMPILFAVLLIALLVHSYAINLPGRGFANPVAAPVVVAPAVVVTPAPAG